MNLSDVSKRESAVLFQRDLSAPGVKGCATGCIQLNVLVPCSTLPLIVVVWPLSLETPDSIYIRDLLNT